MYDWGEGIQKSISTSYKEDVVRERLVCGVLTLHPKTGRVGVKGIMSEIRFGNQGNFVVQGTNIVGVWVFREW